jgi:hypothetical protein
LKAPDAAILCLLEKQENSRAIMAPKEIEEMLQREGSQVSPDKYDESAETADAHQRRTELLIPVLAACREVWTSGSEEIELMVEKLGDGSRDGE